MAVVRLAGLSPVLGTEGVTVYFWSPDSASIGFYADDNRRRSVPLTGDVPTVITDVELWRHRITGACWSLDRTIIFSELRALYRMPESGGAHARGPSGFMPAGLPGGRWMYREGSEMGTR